MASRTAADSRLAMLSPESIRVAVIASNSTACVFTREAKPDDKTLRTGVGPSSLTPDTLVQYCATDSETMLFDGALTCATSVTQLQPPPPPTDAKGGSTSSTTTTKALRPSTCLILASEFNHTVPPTKIRYGVLLILQHAGEESSPGVATALAHWGAYSRGLRGLLYRLVDTVAGAVESLAATSGPQSAIDVRTVQKHLKDHKALGEVFTDVLSCIWTTVGHDGFGPVIKTYPMLSAVNSATTAAALSAFNSRHRNLRVDSSRRLSATSLVGEAPSVASTPLKHPRTDMDTPPEGGELPSARPGPSLPSAFNSFSATPTPSPHRPHVISTIEAVAHNACVENDRVDALVTIYSKSAELLAQIVSCCIGLSHPDSWISPFTFGVSDKLAALHVDDLPPSCVALLNTPTPASSAAFGSEHHPTPLMLPAASPNWRSEFIDRVSPNQSPCDREPRLLPPLSTCDATKLGTSTRIVICTTDEDLGRASLIACATYFRSDASASQLHRMLWNPASVLKPDDSGDDDDESLDTASTSSRYASSPAVYPDYAMRLKRFDGCLNPILWLEQPSLTSTEEEQLLNCGSYSRLLVIKATVTAGGNASNLASYCTVVFAKPVTREAAAIGIVPKAARCTGVTLGPRFPLTSCVAVRHRLELLFGAPLPNTLLANAAATLPLELPRRANSALAPNARGANRTPQQQQQQAQAPKTTPAPTTDAPVKVDIATAAAFQDVLGSIDVLRFILPQRAKAMRETLASFSKSVPSQQLCGTDPRSLVPPTNARQQQASQQQQFAPTWGSRDSSFVSASAPISNDLIASAKLLGDNVLLLQPGAKSSGPAAASGGKSAAAAPSSPQRPGGAAAPAHTRSRSFDATTTPKALPARAASDAQSDPGQRITGSSAVKRIVDAYSSGDAFMAALVLGDPMVYGAYAVIDDMAQRKQQQGGVMA